jgi:uncharacterized membrane protein YgcG
MGGMAFVLGALFYSLAIGIFAGITIFLLQLLTGTGGGGGGSFGGGGASGGW